MVFLMSGRPINQYCDESGGWYVLKAHNKYLEGWSFWGKPIWSPYGHAALVFRHEPRRWDTDEGIARAGQLLEENPCVQAVKFWAVEQSK